MVHFLRCVLAFLALIVAVICVFFLFDVLASRRRPKSPSTGPGLALGLGLPYANGDPSLLRREILRPFFVVVYLTS